MPELGQCGDPSCDGTTVRLFNCAHHCMKMVCLQHLIQHDRIIEREKQLLENHRTELKQIWAIYSSIVDENKIRLEYEEKLHRHRQLMRDTTDLFESNSTNIEHYRSLLDKLKQTIGEDKELPESNLQTDRIKIEPIDEMSTMNEFDFSQMNSASAIEKSNDDDQQQEGKSQMDESVEWEVPNDDNKPTLITNPSMVYENDRPSIDTCEHDEANDDEDVKSKPIRYLRVRELSGECPFYVDGAFGVTRAAHGIQLCNHRQNYRILYNHFCKCHKLSLPSIYKISHAIQRNENPATHNLFTPDDIVIDPLNNLTCPFSPNESLPSSSSTSRKTCRSIKPHLGYSLRSHLIRSHSMTYTAANKLIATLRATHSRASCTTIELNKTIKPEKIIPPLNQQQRQSERIKRLSRH